MRALGVGSFAPSNISGSVAPPPPVAEWTLRTAPALKNWRDIVWSPTLGRFVAVADGLVDLQTARPFMYSDDGITWTEGSYGSTLTQNLQAVAWGGPGPQRFIAAGTAAGTNKVSIISNDGITWTNGPSHTFFLRSIVWTGTMFFASADQGQAAIWNGNIINPSWTQFSTLAYRAGFGSAFWGGPAGSERLLLLTGFGTGQGTSTIQYTANQNGTSGWTYATAPLLDYHQAAYGNGVFVAVASVSGSIQGQVVTSPDGETWTQQTLTPAQAAIEWYGITFTGTEFVAVGKRGDNTTRVMRSSDGVSWTLETTPDVLTFWQRLAQGSSIIAAVGVSAPDANSAIMTLAD